MFVEGDDDGGLERLFAVVFDDDGGAVVGEFEFGADGEGLNDAAEDFHEDGVVAVTEGAEGHFPEDAGGGFGTFVEFFGGGGVEGVADADDAGEDVEAGAGFAGGVAGAVEIFVVGADDHFDGGGEVVGDQVGAGVGVFADFGAVVISQFIAGFEDVFQGVHGDVDEHSAEAEGKEIDGDFVGEVLGGGLALAFADDVIADGRAEDHAEVEDVSGVGVEVAGGGGIGVEQGHGDGVVFEEIDDGGDLISHGLEVDAGEIGVVAEAFLDVGHGGGDFGGDGGGDFAFFGVVFEVDDGIEDGIADFEGDIGVFSAEDLDVIFAEHFSSGKHGASLEEEGFGEAHARLKVGAGYE